MHVQAAVKFSDETVIGASGKNKSFAKELIRKKYH